MHIPARNACTGCGAAPREPLGAQLTWRRTPDVCATTIGLAAEPALRKRGMPLRSLETMKKSSAKQPSATRRLPMTIPAIAPEVRSEAHKTGGREGGGAAQATGRHGETVSDGRQVAGGKRLRAKRLPVRGTPRCIEADEASRARRATGARAACGVCEPGSSSPHAR